MYYGNYTCSCIIIIYIYICLNGKHIMQKSRKRHDNGSGRLWTFSRYNDSCGDVNADDCPASYRLETAV